MFRGTLYRLSKLVCGNVHTLLIGTLVQVLFPFTANSAINIDLFWENTKHALSELAVNFMAVSRRLLELHHYKTSSFRWLTRAVRSAKAVTFYYPRCVKIMGAMHSLRSFLGPNQAAMSEWSASWGDFIFKKDPLTNFNFPYHCLNMLRTSFFDELKSSESHTYRYNIYW